jgi:diguanylate cyclase (GGDEF)-like protein
MSPGHGDSAERESRPTRESWPTQRARLLAALRERQALVERLSRLQRAIADGDAIESVLEAVLEGACELLGDEAGVLRRWSANGEEIVAARGVDPAELRSADREPGIGAHAREHDRTVVVDTVAGGDPALPRAEFGAAGIGVGIACPVYERGAVVASLAVGSRDELRAYGPRDQQVLLAFAELASLAMTHARAIADASHEAFHDGLTGLPNRSLFVDRLEHALARAERTRRPVAVLFCDLDGFKTVNDSLGHAAGDELLVEVGRRLSDALRPADTVARIGGDEFAVLLEELKEQDGAARAARRALEVLSVPFTLRGREVYIGASIGIATGLGDAGSMLRNADLAMYRAKGDGKGRYALFEPRLHTAVVDRLELEIDLKRALEGGELELVFQPIFRLRSGEIAGLESLVRWRHPTRGLVEPERFIPLAEESGHIRALGRWVIREACRQGALWRARYPGFKEFQIAVNISGAQLQEDIVQEVEAALEAAQLDPGGLTLEITETALMRDVEKASECLTGLKALGVEIAIDDFGRGYSSLTHLRRFPLDKLKIDRDFLATAARPGGDRRLLQAILDLAEVFDLLPIAEGIERPEELDLLLELGCDLGQGHLLASPMSPGDADALLLKVGLVGSPPGGLPLGSPADAGDPDPLAGDHDPGGGSVQGGG